MKIAFSVTALDLARTLSTIARQAADPTMRRPAGGASTVSPQARRALAEDREADDGQS